MNDLAGGFYKGDQVVNKASGRSGTVFGKPARAACSRISVAVLYDDGQMVDERTTGISLLSNAPEPSEEHAPPPMGLPIYQREETGAYGRPAVPPISGFSQKQQEPFYSDPRHAIDPRDEQYGDSPREDDDSLDRTRDFAQEARMVENGFHGGRQEADEDEIDPRAQAHRHAQDFDDARVNGQVDERADDMVDTVLEKIRRNYDNLRMAFRALDRSNNGFVTRADFFDALEHVFLTTGHTHEDINEVAERFQLGRDDVLSYAEFCDIVQAGEQDRFRPGHDGLEQADETFDKPQGQNQRDRIEKVDLAIQAFRQTCDRRYSSMRDAFRALDKCRRSALGPSEFALGLSMHGVDLDPNELQDAWEMFDPNDNGQVSYADFCKVMSQKVQFGGKHLRRQYYK
jgi:Ca2+-binding EF-hand superfamily protein